MEIRAELSGELFCTANNHDNYGNPGNLGIYGNHGNHGNYGNCLLNKSKDDSHKLLNQTALNEHINQIIDIM